MCGALSGAVAAFLTTPFDVLKTRRQVRDAPTTAGAGAGGVCTGSGGGGGVCSGGGGVMGGHTTLPELVRIARVEGVGALWTGWVPRLVKVAPSCAIMIASYEFGKAFFARRRHALQQQ